MENNTVFKSNSYFKCGTLELERETCLGDDLVLLRLHYILNSAHNGVGADAVLLDEHLRRAGSWHLADREALQYDVTRASGNISNSAAEAALWIVVFDGHNFATAFPRILEDGLLVEGFDGKGIHNPDINSRGFQGLGCNHCLLKSDTGSNEKHLVVRAALDDIGLPNLELEVIFIDDWRGRPVEPDESDSLGVGGQFNCSFACYSIRWVKDGASWQTPVKSKIVKKQSTK